MNTIDNIAEARATLRKYLRGSKWTIISADTARANPAELVRARGDLWQRLDGRRKRWIASSWEGRAEAAVIVDDLPLPEAKRLAEDFGQVAFLTRWGEWGRMDWEGLMTPWHLDKWARDMISFDVSDSWSEIEVPREGGVKLRFTLRKVGDQ